MFMSHPVFSELFLSRVVSFDKLQYYHLTIYHVDVAAHLHKIIIRRPRWIVDVVVPAQTLGLKINSLPVSLSVGSISITFY